MADFKSSFITASEGTTGPVAAKTGNANARISVKLYHWAKTAAQTNGDTIFLFPVHSTDRPLGIFIANDALTGATDINIGLWSAAETPVDVDENLFADAINIATGSATWAQVDEIAVEKRGLPIWALLGGTEPTSKTYYLALNLVTGGTAVGDVAVRMDCLI
jgi:hypothetical protein